MALKMPLPGHAEFQKFIENAPTSLDTRTAFSSWAIRAKTALECQESDITFSDLSAAIPVSEDAGALSFSALAFLLSQGVPGTSTFDILRCYTRLWAGLPEVAKTFQDQYATPVLEDVLSQVKSSIGSLPSLFQSESNLPALVDPTSQRALTHGQLSSFIRDFKLPLAHNISESKPVVVLALPNGYLLGLTLLAVSSYCTSTPINTAGGPQQFRAEVELAKPNAILVLEADVQRLGLDSPWVTESGIQILVVEPDVETGMTFSVRPLNGSQSLRVSKAITPNSANDYALILFTSGTSGTKKVVPVTCLELLTGITCVIDSWGLTPEDSCVNMMPLNHVGGIVRNLFAPVLSGGSTILCPAFDPNSFWDILQDGRGTWYYASPSMHMSILAEGGMRPEALARCRLRLVCNAAGGLLPALAVRLRETFSCIVLPSYGMTECMPISTPPLDYTLTRPGTSGISCGPEIAILDDSDHVLPPGQVGRINVRGGPCFGGYLKGEKIDTSIFNKSGWFDTGDLGSLDEDGYLYLTGRGKEVINRGGELISPFEVEEAITLASQNPNSTLFKRVNQVMAFSAPDDLLQEVVGVAIVTPKGMPRPDVRDLQAALKTSLHSSKWPIVVVYINALPTSNNKIVRIRFGERLDLPTITKEMTLAQRHFEAIAPPVNCPLTTKILKTTCTTDVRFVTDIVQKHLAVEIESYVGLSHHDGTPEVFLAPTTEAPTSIPSSFIVDIIRTRLREEIDGFMLPSKIECLEKPFPRLPSSIIDVTALEQMLKDTQRAHVTAPTSQTEEQIRRAFSEVLGFDIEELSSDADFFEMGGDSLSAGRLLSILRRDLQVRIPVDQLFGASKVSEICEHVEDMLQVEAHAFGSQTEPLPGCTETYSSTNPLVLAINLLPILLFYPMKIGLQWTSLMYALSQISEMWDERIFASKFLALIGAMFISRAVTQIVSPLVGIFFKWVVMGKYREGMYPMWGPYHTRWWVTQKVLIICGKGMFRHLDTTRIWYYQLLGAKIGKGVTIEKGTTLGEYDLLDIGDNVHLNRCTCRPFAAERNTSMYLGKIVIGKNSSIGLKSHVAAGSVLPEDTFIGANSSSYEINATDSADRIFFKPPRPHILLQIFGIIPIKVVVLFISSLPWMAGLWGIVSTESEADTNNVKTIISWWATPRRILYHYIAQSLHVSVRPVVWILLVIVIKRVLTLVFGPAKAKSRDERTQRDKYRTHLMSELVPNGSIKSFTKLFGTHYEVTSIAVRALGAKVGKRVYWPGTGPSIQDFDLVEIGDDVVFGSRSHITTSDAFGSAPVRVGNSAMIADRVVLSPGTSVGDRTILGSGAFIKRDQHCFPDTVWVGNRKGSALCLSSTSSNVTSRVPTLLNSRAPTLMNALDSQYSEESSINKDTTFILQGASIVESPRSSIDLGIGFGNFFESGLEKCFESGLEKGIKKGLEKGFKTSPKVKISEKTRKLTFDSLDNPNDSNRSFVPEKDLENGDGIKTHISEKSRTNTSTTFGTISTITSDSPDSGSSTPFGRAFYEGKAPYWVLGQFPIFLYSTFTTIFVQIYWNVGTITTIMLSQIMNRTDEFHPHWYRPIKIYAVDVALLSGMYLCLSSIALTVCIAAKWLLLGRRKKGSYDWDKSSYCQRWQIFLTIEAIRRRSFSGNGVLGMLTGTYWCALYFRLLGAKIGRDCALFAGGRPSLVFTEPDLLELGERVTTDDASLVCHINSRGNFSLNELKVGARSVLRSGSRLLSGARMGSDTMLLEHTLIMAGDEADEGRCYQGWPADVYQGKRLTGL